MDITKLTGHTPGPWKRNGMRVMVKGRGVIAEFPTPGTHGVFDVQDNILLVESAPDLLALAKLGLKLAERHLAVHAHRQAVQESADCECQCQLCKLARALREKARE